MHITLRTMKFQGPRVLQIGDARGRGGHARGQGRQGRGGAEVAHKEMGRGMLKALDILNQHSMGAAFGLCLVREICHGKDPALHGGRPVRQKSSPRTEQRAIDGAVVMHLRGEQKDDGLGEYVACEQCKCKEWALYTKWAHAHTHVVYTRRHQTHTNTHTHTHTHTCTHTHTTHTHDTII